MNERIMYIEYKGHGQTGPARIGKVKFSQSNKTIYYKGKTFQLINGTGFQANYYDIDTGEQYRISGCNQKGNDTPNPCIIKIDEDVQEEYWLKIRKIPGNINLSQFRTNGNYAK